MGPAGVWDRGVSSRDQAMLWDREVPGADRSGTAGPHPVGAASVCAAGSALAAHGRELVCGEDGHHSYRHSGVFGSSTLHSPLQSNCVTPTSIDAVIAEKA